MSSPPSGAEHDRVAGEVGWARELNERPKPAPVEPLQEPLRETIRRVLVSPWAAMVDLGRDVEAVRKGVIVTIAYGAAAAAVTLGQASLGYPPGGTVLDGGGWLWVVLSVPLTLLGTLIAAHVLRLAIPRDLDRRVGPAFGRLALSWGVPGFVILALGAVEIVMLAVGAISPDALLRLYEESLWLSLVVLVFSAWPVFVTAIAIRVATERNWLVVVVLLVLTTFVAILPTLLPLLLV